MSIIQPNGEGGERKKPARIHPLSDLPSHLLATSGTTTPHLIKREERRKRGGVWLRFAVADRKKRRRKKMCFTSPRR